MVSYTCSYKPPNMSYNSSYLTYNPTYNYPLNLQVRPETPQPYPLAVSPT